MVVEEAGGTVYFVLGIVAVQELLILDFTKFFLKNVIYYIVASMNNFYVFIRTVL